MSIFIGVGSNIDPQENILKAFDLLEKHVQIRTSSNFYLTKAIGNKEQDSYYNGVWEVETTLDPMELKFKVLRKVEDLCGRIRSTDKYASRIIDLDLLLYHNRVVSTPEINLPDQDIYKRNFIAIPLYEINPKLLVPDTKTPICDIISNMNSQDMKLLGTFTSMIQERILNGS